jgi:hypothetical protein
VLCSGANVLLRVVAALGQGLVYGIIWYMEWFELVRVGWLVLVGLVRFFSCLGYSQIVAKAAAGRIKFQLRRELTRAAAHFESL